MGSVNDAQGLLARIFHGPWVGRSLEMAAAKMAWLRASSGECQILLVSGEPGVGKSRFVRELILTAQAAGVLVMAGKCFQEGSVPYAPITQMISSILDLSSPATSDLPSDALINLASVVPSLRLRFPDRIPMQIQDAQSAQLRIFEGFVSLCTSLTTKAPLLLFIDDAPWADTDTLFLLRNLTRRGRSLPILIVMTYRAAELESMQPLNDLLLELNRERLAVNIRLAPFRLEETRELLTALFEKELTPEFLNGIYDQTEGNPFYIEEVCKSLVEDGQFAFQNENWQFPSLADIKIPQTVQAAIQARLQQLPASTQAVLRLAAILGSEFEFETLRQASGLDEEILIAALESSVRAHIIREEKPGQAGAVRFSFVHVLIPTTLRESILLVRRQRLHLQIAQAIEAIRPGDFEALAYHLSEAGENERALDYFRRAGDRALQTAPGDAACFYQSALENWPDQDQAGKAEILAHLGYCLWVVADFPGALKCFEDAYGLFIKLENRTRSGEMQRLIGRMYWEGADRKLALQHYHQALAILEGGPETPELARAISSISQMHMIAPDDDQAIVWGQRALQMAERLGAEDVVVHAMNNIGSSYAQKGDFDKGITILQESLQRSLAANLTADACRAYYNLGTMLQRQCKYADTKKVWQELYTYSVKVYAKTYINHAIWRSMWLDWITGQWSSALAYRSQMVEFYSDLYLTWSKRSFGMIDLDLGRSQDGLRVLEESLASALRAMDLQTAVSHLGQIVRAYAAVGQEAKTIEAIHQILEFVSSTHNLTNDSVMPLLIACQQLARWTTPEASEDARTCLAQLERHNLQYQTGETSAALAEARGNLFLRANPNQAIEHFRQAASEWEKIERPFDRARALGSLGHALAAAGDAPSARSSWNQAMEIYNVLAAQLDPELRASFLNSPIVKEVRQSESIAPHQMAGQEINRLTARELEVLKLVSQGLTNAQIAEKLVVSPLTINAHLRSIFNKLDVTTRTAAAHQAIERGLV